MKKYVLVEGHGEVSAMENLLAKLSARLSDFVPWARPLRWPNLHQWDAARGGVRAGIDFIRGKSDVAGLLLIRDEDDGCPATLAPQVAEQIRLLAAPFPVAYVLLKPEYEVLFLPCLDLMAGRELEGRAGLLPGTVWDGAHWESRRGIKEWLSSRFPRGKAYKPTVDQLPLTRMLDLQRLSDAAVPCFGTLERALQFLAQGAVGVYPEPLARSR